MTTPVPRSCSTCLIRHHTQAASPARSSQLGELTSNRRDSSNPLSAHLEAQYAEIPDAPAPVKACSVQPLLHPQAGSVGSHP